MVVPSPNLDPDLQPGGKMETKEAAGRAPERHILAFWFGSIDKIWRKRVVSQMQKYQEQQEQQEQQTRLTRPVVIHGIDGDYVARDIWQTTASSPQMVLEEMMRSEFCPVVQGDVPHQKRLFDAMLTGCIPVVVAFQSHVPDYVSWWLPGGPPIERMVPFWDAIDYRSFVVEVSESEVRAGRFMDRLLRITHSEIQQRREAMRHARALVRFDFSGSAPDAFTEIVGEIWKFISTLGGPSRCHGKGIAVPFNATGFDCGVPPTIAEGTQMYGLMACCPLGATSRGFGTRLR